MATLIDDIKQSFKQGTNLIKLIYINLAVFIIINLVQSFAFFTKADGFDLTAWLAVPAHPLDLLTKPWTIVSYMFLHEGFWHIVFNLITLYFGGRIFEDLLGSQRLLSTYLLGGMAGALLFVLSYNFIPVFENMSNARMLGASAAALAIFVAVATKAPNYVVSLFGVFAVKLKYIALFFVLIDLVSFRDGNAGGHFAHIGGAIYGFLYIKQLDRGRDWSLGFYNFLAALGSIFKSKPKMKVAYKTSPSSGHRRSTSKVSVKVHQSTIDEILDKISKSGYDSLTKEEKDILFKASQHK